MQSPPQAGEVWVNIHTSSKVTIQSIQEVAQARGGFVVIYDAPNWKSQRCDIASFNVNWKRHKTASKWFLGAFNS